jgi:hypothetical protein
MSGDSDTIRILAVDDKPPDINGLDAVIATRGETRRAAGGGSRGDDRGVYDMSSSGWGPGTPAASMRAARRYPRSARARTVRFP